MSTVHLKMLKVTQPDKHFTAFCGNKTITLFTAVLHWSPNTSQINPVHITPYFLNINSNVILLSTPRYGQVVSSVQVFRLKFSMNLLGPLLAVHVVTLSTCVQITLIKSQKLALLK